MARTHDQNTHVSEGAAAKAAPERTGEGGDVKVPIEVDAEVMDATGTAEGEAAQPASEDEATVSGTAVAGTAAPEGGTSETDDEQARIDAAIRAGEEAAEADFKADSDHFRKERDELAKKLAQVDGEIAAAKAAAADSAEKLVRLQADWDNYRRRTRQEREDEKARATEKLVTNLLPVIDDMERAIAHSAKAAEQDENLKQFSEGIEAVHTKMVDVLHREGVEVINPEGQPFEPLDHQAVGRVDDASAYEDTVRDVYQPGYRMGGKVIRPAMVTVTCGGPKRPAPEDEAGTAGPAGTKASPTGDAGTKEDGKPSGKEAAE